MTITELMAALEAAGLRPAHDRPMGTVKADCPSCRGGDSDPQRIWLPLTVIPNGRDRLALHCAAGCEARAIKAAMRAPVNWEQIAMELYDIAKGMLAFLPADDDSEVTA